MELLGRMIELLQSNGFGDVVGGDSDFCSCFYFKQHIVSVHIDVTGSGMALVIVDSVQMCHIVHVVQV